MKITTVTYRTNRPTTGSKYIHEHVEATAVITKGETAAQTLEKLKAEVRAMLYPELTGLRDRIAKNAPVVSGHFIRMGLTDTQLAELYGEHTEAFQDLLKGELAPRDFISEYISNKSAF